MARGFYVVVTAAWLAFAAGVVHAFGQDAASSSAPSSSSATGAPAAPSEFTLTVSADDLATINQGLQGLNPPPFGKVAPLMQKLQGQIVKQQAPVQSGSQGAPSSAAGAAEKK
jgi:hypothetical protein